MVLLSGPGPSVERPAGWLGVVGSTDSLNRLTQDGEHWWCLPSSAELGSVVAMYCTSQASKPQQGVFAFFRLEAFDAERDTECRSYGSSSGYGAMSFAQLSLLQRIDPSLPTKLLRADPIFGAAQCVRRSFQGTFFALSQCEVKRLRRLADLSFKPAINP
jgi:hypothetical protein